MSKMVRTIVSIGSLSALTAFALDDITVPAPDGVGDVVALTNAITRAKAGSYRNVLLEPGLYDLKDVAMTTVSHLDCTGFNNHYLIGAGSRPADVILKGGGEAIGKRVVALQGNNFGYATLSNLTITGGYSSGNGGGVLGHASARIVDCIVSNNFALGGKNGGGGGMYKGSAIGCLFTENVAGRGNEDPVHGGGLWCNGDVTSGKLYQRAVGCTFSNNWSEANGGGFYGGLSVSDCTFVGNQAGESGGGAYNCTNLTGCVFVGNVATEYGGGYCGHGDISGCTFEKNKAAKGGGLYADAASGYGPISNCTFRMNAATSAGCAVMSADTAHGTTLVKSVLLQNTNGVVTASTSVTYRDSVITNHYGKRTILQNCNLYGCLVADNRAVDTTDSTKTYVIDSVDSGVACTNANCIFENNYTSGSSKVKITNGAKVVLNCLYVGNTANNGNFGHIIDSSATVYNTVYLENLVGTRANFNKDAAHPTLVNCTYSGAGTDIETLDRCTGVFRATRAQLKFSAKGPARPYAPSRRSPLRNAAYEEPWLIAALGARDFYGETRVFEGALDIGPAECVETALGVILLFR